MRRPTMTALLGVALALTAPVAIADPPPGSTPFHGEFQFRGGGSFPTAGGDFWEGTQEVFTLEPSDLNSFVLGLTYVGPVGKYLEVGFNAGFYDQTVTTGYRDWVDGAGFPILHDTRVSSMPLTVDLRVVPGGRFKQSGPYLERKPVFYFGGGIGANYWEYEEVGDFLDFGFDPPEIFSDRFVDSGWALATEALAGLEVPLGRRMGVVIEGRYLWSDAELDGDFAGLGTIDFGGPAAFAGLSISF